MVKVLGKEKVDYVSKKTGKPVIGISLHCVFETHHEDFEGMRVDVLFISTRNPMYEQCLAIPVGSEISVSYNRFGNVESVSLCDPKK